ncbi:hypothetical protein AB8O64_19865 [Streptomyces sp. QH1-20]|uniref:hypothetical protein n=1 Tax=Streptomyces sp. QH1-20 TaxID=3240934 RepID=UPI00351186B5
MNRDDSDNDFHAGGEQHTEWPLPIDEQVTLVARRLAPRIHRSRVDLAERRAA